MTGPEHYTEAERLATIAIDPAYDMHATAYLLQQAQVHATLALTAATAMYPVGITLDGDTALAWREAIL